jgi:hypothetical protein
MMSPYGAYQRVPRRAFQIAAPGRLGPTSWVDSTEYGSSFGSPQARKCLPDARRGGPIPGLGDPGKVNQFCLI